MEGVGPISGKLGEAEGGSTELDSEDGGAMVNLSVGTTI